MGNTGLLDAKESVCVFSPLPACWTREVGTAREAAGDSSTSLVGGDGT